MFQLLYHILCQYIYYRLTNPFTKLAGQCMSSIRYEALLYNFMVFKSCAWSNSLKVIKVRLDTPRCWKIPVREVDPGSHPLEHLTKPPWGTFRYPAAEMYPRTFSPRKTKILTGHGCFGKYLNRIGRESTAQCHHCRKDEVSTQHTLLECLVRASERKTLIVRIR